MDADSAGPRPWDLHFEDSNGQPFLLAADSYRCCSAHSRVAEGNDDLPWDDRRTWDAASSSISRYAKDDKMLKELVSMQTPDHAGRALTSVAEFDYLISKIKDSRGHKGRFISAWRARIVAFLPPLSPLPHLAPSHWRLSSSSATSFASSTSSCCEDIISSSSVPRLRTPVQG